MKNPRAFISYSWTSPGHQGQILHWAEQLVRDGVDVVLDLWDLKEGDDKYAYMERMVTDESVTHVLMFCDSEYAKKADARKAGVGTESQIISSEIYAKAKQTKFIPIVCEFDGRGEPCIPTFLKARKWINFSSPESANENWEQLIRVLHGKPIHEKPKLGKAPVYLSAHASAPASPAPAKFATLRQAILQNRPGVKLYREDFLQACYQYVDELRIRERPDVENFGERVLEDCGKLKLVRDHLIDWVLLESSTKSDGDFGDNLIQMLERLLELKSRPPEVTRWNETWFEAHNVFVYETFLYIVAALMKTEAYEILNLVLTNNYLLPETDRYGVNELGTIYAFYGRSDALQVLAPEGQKLYSPAAELIKRQADRADLPFEAVMQAELLILMMALIDPQGKWYPQTLHYSSRSPAFPFFARAAQRRNFLKLTRITGIENADELRKLVREGYERLGVERWSNFWIERPFWSYMNMDALDTIR